MSDQLPNGAYEFLRRKILSSELAPHARIKEQEVAAQLGISRTPVREALARLEMDGLVTRSPRRGAIVSRVELDEIDEIYDLRAVLETLVVRAACEHVAEPEIEEMEQALHGAQACIDSGDLDAAARKTVHFHSLLNQASRRPRLVALLRSLEDRLASFRHLGFRHPGRAASIMRQHWSIVDALRRRDALEMQRWMKEHVEEGRATTYKVYLDEARGRRMSNLVKQVV